MIMKWRVLWVTDPWDTLDHPRDTPLRLAEECLALGVECHWCDFQSIRWDNAGIRLVDMPVALSRSQPAVPGTPFS
jgi:hypothetical protein